MVRRWGRFDFGILEEFNNCECPRSVSLPPHYVVLLVQRWHWRVCVHLCRLPYDIRCYPLGDVRPHVPSHHDGLYVWSAASEHQGLLQKTLRTYLRPEKRHNARCRVGCFSGPPNGGYFRQLELDSPPCYLCCPLLCLLYHIRLDACLKSLRQQR